MSCTIACCASRLCGGRLGWIVAATVLLGASQCCGPPTAQASVYTLDYVYAGLFAITNVGLPEDPQNESESWIDPILLNETKFADSFSGLSWATAESNLDYATTAMTLSGSGSLDNNAFRVDPQYFATSNTEAFVDILFTVPVPTLYTLEATVSKVLIEGGPSTFISHVIGYNFGVGSSGFAVSAIDNATIAPSGILTPAQYRLSAQVKILDSVGAGDDPSIDSNASFDFLLTLTPVPEPTSFALIAATIVAIVGCAAWRRHHTN